MGILKTTLLGGFVFLLPLVLVVVTLGKAFQIIKFLAQPLDRLFPNITVVGVMFMDLVTFILMVATCLLAGLAARSSFAKKLHGKIDAVLLHVFPGYGWIRGVTSNVGVEESEGFLKPVLARFDDQSQIGFEVDRTEDGLVAIYLPGAPDPSGGTLSYVTADRVQPIDVGAQTVITKFKKLGRGSATMLGEVGS